MLSLAQNDIRVMNKFVTNDAEEFGFTEPFNN